MRNKIVLKETTFRIGVSEWVAKAKAKARAFYVHQKLSGMVIC